MTPFGFRRGPQPTEEEQRAAEADLERIRQGGIPLGAEQRLKRLATASTPFFTSDLTAKEYALAQASGLQPVAQVMGSSVVKHGYMGQQIGSSWGQSEVTSLSEPWNMARDRAFERLRQEAEFAGADGVIGIEISTTGSLGEADNVEYVVFGTAVRDSVLPRQAGSGLRMCALSGQEVDKLRRIGAEVRGVVGHTTVISIALQPGSNYVMNAWTSRNAEITEISQAVSDARRRAMTHVEHQARSVDANSLVIAGMRHTIQHREVEYAGTTHHYFYVTMHVLGTAIRLGAHDPHPTPLSTPMMSINLGL